MRINKALSLANIASRRGAERLIQEGRIRCNGHIVSELGMKISPQDILTFDDKLITIPFEDVQYSYVILNKPIRYISSVYDPQGRRTVLSLLPSELQEQRIYPVGRLDYFSEGLLLLSNDGDFTYRITHPKHHIAKEYDVIVRSPIDEKKLYELRKGFKLSTGELLAPMKTKIHKRDVLETHFSIILHQGINRQIRRICADMNWVILHLTRVRIGKLSLDRLNIKKGSYRVVTKKKLIKMLGIRENY